MSREGKEPIVKLLVTIMDRGKGERAVEFYRSRGLPYHFITLGFGTANSQILDYFGLSETEKDIVLTLVQEERVLRLLQDTTAAFRMTGPGRGILFTLPLSGVSGRVPQILEYTAKEKEEAGMEEKQETAGEAEERKVPFDLVLTMVERGNVDTVMQAASKAGARGGTVLHVRRVGYEEAESFLGFTIQPEKEIVAILAPRTMKHEMMLAINEAAGIKTDCRGLLMSLPVDDIMGL